MKFPSLFEYQNAVQSPRSAFVGDLVLAGGETQRNGLGLPVVASGGVAATFRVNASGRSWAVRCFHKQETHDRRLLDRYRHISDFVTSNSELGFLVSVAYHENGVVVNQTSYPTVRMPWVDGEPLGIWLEDWADQRNPDGRELDRVRRHIHSAVFELQRRGAAHGDLQHGNILVRSDQSIWLIDYDGAYLPSLSRGFGAIEQGHRNYQHPDRGEHYDADLDRFSAAVIDLSLLALARRPELWRQLAGTGENLLFSADDFAAPRRSKAFESVFQLPGLEAAAQALLRACETRYSHIRDALSGRAAPVMTARPAAGPDLVLNALDTERLRGLQGQRVTVFGTVRSTRFIPRGHTGQPHILINLGDYRKGQLTFVVYAGEARALYTRYGGTMAERGRFGSVPGLEGLQVAANGTVTLYASRWCDDPTPQIELDRASQLRLIDDQRYRAYQDDAGLAGHRAGRSARRPAEPNATSYPTASPRHGLSPAPPADRERSTSDFYAAPRFHSPTNPTPPAPRSAPGPSARLPGPPPMPLAGLAPGSPNASNQYQWGVPPPSYGVAPHGAPHQGAGSRRPGPVLWWLLGALVLLIILVTLI